MYDVTLTEAYFPAQADTPYAERTIAEALREQAAIRPDAKALRELLADGTVGREWSFAGLLRDAERCGRALGAVLSEIDEIAKATFRSITLATMLRLLERQQRAGRVRR